ncbi:MAG: NapC/NirT family cytochrome c [Pseudomonadota bacterium]
MQRKKETSGGSKMKMLFAVVPLVIVLFFVFHEVSVRSFQEVTCAVCHEMKDPITKWKESETMKNHSNCAGCHFDAGVKGRWDMTKAAATEFVTHFQRDPNEPIQPASEPLFLEEGKVPAYWSYVPNYRCFQCKNAKNHKESDQEQIHSKLIKAISKQPCKDCHNHEMQEGQKFYQKILPEQKQVALKQ